MKAKSFLIDTHIILWWAQGHKQNPVIAEAIRDPNNYCFISLVSLWEITIKHQSGKIEVPKNFNQIMNSHGFLSLLITQEHIQTLYKLPPIHKDPFDRLLAAQCLVENLTLITIDKNLLQYPIKLLKSS